MDIRSGMNFLNARPGLGPGVAASGVLSGPGRGGRARGPAR